MLADLDRAAITSAPDAPAVLHAPFASSPTPAADLVGPARVIDGDTLAIDGQRIRLHGVDAFERRQTCGGRPCGEEGRRALQALTAGRQVSCRSLDIDRYGRTIARFRADGRDLGAEMVRSGHALAYERYSIDYVDEERAARSAGAGAWAHGDFIVPEDYRHGG